MEGSSMTSFSRTVISSMLLTYIVCAMPTLAVHVFITSQEAVLGYTGVISCQAIFTSKETDRQLLIERVGLALSFQWWEEQNVSSLQDHDTRYSMYTNYTGGNTVVMTLKIDALTCQDAGVYLCTAKTISYITTLKTELSHGITLTITVPQLPPNYLKIDPNSLAVREHGWFDVECQAVVGLHQESCLVWKISRGRQVEVVKDFDPRVIEQEAHNNSGDYSCTRQLTSRLRLVVTRKDQGSQVACFVCAAGHEQTEPSHCIYPRKQFCVRTPSFHIHYGVTRENMKLNIQPKENFSEGAPVSLVCEADSFPTANFTWSRSPPLQDSFQNSSIFIRHLGNTSWLTLTSFDPVLDSGIYLCTAHNWVMGLELFSAFQEIVVTSGQIGLKQEHLTISNNAFSWKNYDTLEKGIIAVTIISGVIVIVAGCFLLIICIRRYCLKKRLQQENQDVETSVTLDKSNAEPANSSQDSPVRSSVTDFSIETV